MSDLLSPSVLADYLGISEATLQDWRYRGIGPDYLKLGKHVRYRKDDINAWLDAQAKGRG